jgi:hypothetical protein
MGQYRLPRGRGCAWVVGVNPLTCTDHDGLLVCTLSRDRRWLRKATTSRTAHTMAVGSAFAVSVL